MSDTTPILPAHIEDTIQAIAKLHSDHKRSAGWQHRVVEKVTAGVGRPNFVAALSITLIIWIGENLSAARVSGSTWDPPPFNWLQGVVGLMALYVSVIISTVQRRDDQLASHREQLTLELSILSEQKSAKIISLLEEMRRDSSTLPNRVDTEAAAMSEATDPQAVLDAIKNSEPDEDVLAAL